MMPDENNSAKMSEAESMADAEQAFAQGIDQRAWKILTDGIPEEQENFQQGMQEKLARADETPSRE